MADFFETRFRLKGCISSVTFMPFLMLHELIVDKHSFVIVLQIRSKKVSFPNCMVNDRICSFRGNVLVTDLIDFLFTDLLVFFTMVSFMFVYYVLL